MRQTACKALVGRFLQSRWQINRNPAPTLSFRPWPFFVQPGCKLANRVRTQVRTFCVATIPHKPAMSGLSPAGPRRRVRTANPANLVFWSDGSAMLRSRPPYGTFGRKDPFCLGACVRALTTTMGNDHHHRHNQHRSVAARDDGDGCDGRRLLFTPASAHISIGGATITRCQAPASTPGCPAGRAARARRRCDRGARRKTRGTGIASVARRAGRAS